MKNIILTIVIYGFILSCQEKTNDKLIWADEFDYDGYLILISGPMMSGDHGWGNNELKLQKKKMQG